jgi:MFS family permease
LSKSKPQTSPPGKQRSGFRSIASRWPRKRWQQQVLRFTAGGRWTDRLHPAIRQNLRWFWFDGAFASASESIVIAYLSLFVLALGATRAQIGLMSSLSSLSAALLLLPGAAIVERWGRRKQIVVLSGGGVSRIALLLLALVPLAFAGPAAVYVAIALAIVRSAATNLGVPAWISLTADIVPLKWRGRYFSSRNMAMEVAKMVMTLLVGQLIAYVGAPGGYQLAMGLAFAVGIASTYSFARLEEESPSAPSIPQTATRRGPQESLLRHLRAHPEFLSFCTMAALWNFSLNIAGPFFNVYLVEGLGASAGIVGVLGVIAPLAALPGQRLLGPLADRWGPRRVQLLTGLLIPLLPLAWTLVRSPWHVAPIHLAGGFLWAGYNLASFNFLLTLTPKDRRPRYSALYQIVVTASLAGGAALGGVIAEQWGYATIFILSSVGRLVAALLFAHFVRQPDEN